MSTTIQSATVLDAAALLEHWQGHRKLSRQLITRFPEDKLHTYSIGGMRPYAALAEEMMRLAAGGVKGIATGDWTPAAKFTWYHEGKIPATKEALLEAWDAVTEEIEAYWPTISEARFTETDKAFGEYEGVVHGLLMYIIDNEIHHRGQGYVYLRSLDIEPPAFWERW